MHKESKSSWVRGAMSVLGISGIIGSLVLFSVIQSELKQTNYIYDYLEIHHITHRLIQWNMLAYFLFGIGIIVLMLGLRKNKH